MCLSTHYGKGEILIVALGGYRQDMRAFDSLVRETENEFQWLLVHLPYINPESEVNAVYTPQELLQNIFAEVHKYSYQRIYLLGFSIGGRIAQNLFLLNPEKFNKLILINADGLKTHLLQWISQKKWISEKLLYRIIESKLWQFLIKNFQKMRFISSKKAKFYLAHIQNTHRRKILIQIWKKYAAYQADVPRLSLYKNKVFLIWSRYDEVLSVKIAHRTAKKHHFSLQIAEASHNIIEQEYKQIAEFLKSI